MNWNFEIHNELKELGKIHCSFCNEKLQDCLVKEPAICCDIINNKGMRVCRSCGVVYGYDFTNEYIDFYNNMYLIRKQSVYHRKYHIENVIRDMIADKSNKPLCES